MKKLALVLLSVLAPAAFGAITLCGPIVVNAGHGAPVTTLTLPLDPSLNRALTTSIHESEGDVNIDVLLGLAPGAPLSEPGCFNVTSVLPHGFEPGDHTVRWNVRRVTSCSADACDAETETFTHVFHVDLPLVCSSEPTFDVYPFPAMVGTPVTVLHAHQSSEDETFGEQTITVTGHTVLVEQSVVPDDALQIAPPIHCVSRTASLGPLPAGPYDITWASIAQQGTRTTPRRSTSSLRRQSRCSVLRCCSCSEGC